ncbi:hypothetical protein [Rheinheimera soli]|uniref:hypothetical protein n=1 Tax=Rheinheimera soli TaxID=443616 RepID=UPI001E404D74|nr:hypothetical protein [Rheinheimera soli]
MSLMRMNHVQNELKKLAGVINKLIENYDLNFREYDQTYSSVESSFKDRKILAEKNKDFDLLHEIHIEENNYTATQKNLNSLAQFQNELMLVKHVALIENMIVSLFWCLTRMFQHSEYEKKYFSEGINFSDSLEAASKICEMTNRVINLKKHKFWYFHETMKSIRNVIAHGDPLFVMSYRRVNKFNEKIDLIQFNSEKNECVYTNRMHPSKIHPTFDSKSNWYCNLKNDLNGLVKLNEICLEFVEEVKASYMKYGESNGISIHNLYGCLPIHQK